MESDKTENLNSSDECIIIEDPEKPTEDIPKNNKDRPLYHRMFGKMDPGSLRGSIFNLCILSLGTGLLAIPQKFGYMGLLISPIIIILCGIANRWSLFILIDASIKYKIQNYENIVKKLFGKHISIFLSIMMCINQFGAIILYQVILYKLLGGVLNEIGGFGYKSVEEFSEKSFWNNFWIRLIVCYGIMIFILFPLCILRNISKMRYASTFGVISLFFLMIIVVFECPFFIKKNIFEEKQAINYYNIIPGLQNDMKFIKSVCTIIYAFSCHVGTFPVLKTLTNPSERRQKKVINRAILVDIVCYLIVGFSGYFTQPLNTPDLIIERNKIFNNDFLMTVGQIFFIFTLIAKTCANYNALRACILFLLGFHLDNFSNKINILMTTLVLLCTTVITVAFQSISDYLSLLGSFCSVLIVFFIPGLIYIQSNEYSKFHYKNILTLVFVSLIVILGFTSGLFTINGIINKYKNEI